VGFVRKLPHDLVEAFRSTLEEVKEATLLLHVVDASRAAERQVDAVDQVLVEIGVTPKPVVLALNKADLIDDVEADQLRKRFPDAVLCSAGTGAGMDELLKAVAAALSGSRVEVRLVVPFDRGDVVARLHEQAAVTAETYNESGTELVAQLPKELLGEFTEYLAPAER
jgi:GTP-binding protein HflX